MDTLYTFRRCPYAMRARLALVLAGINVRLREVDLKHKPEQLLQVSPKATVPVLVRSSGEVLDESLDIVNFACAQAAGSFLQMADACRQAYQELMQYFSEACLPAIYRYKYPNRYEGVSIEHEKEVLLNFFSQLGEQVSPNGYLFSQHYSCADVVLLPFARQILLVDEQWFTVTMPDSVTAWLSQYLNSAECQRVMQKHAPWSLGEQEPCLL